MLHRQPPRCTRHALADGLESKYTRLSLRMQLFPLSGYHSAPHLVRLGTRMSGIAISLRAPSVQQMLKRADSQAPKDLVLACTSLRCKLHHALLSVPKVALGDVLMSTRLAFWVQGHGIQAADSQPTSPDHPPLASGAPTSALP